MSKKRILIIDDEENFCKLVKMNLELDVDFTVETATEGKKGIELAKKFKPDIIILDIMMPKMSGFEVLEKIKKDPKP
jgi:DNA-binding response OmpR family regulator